LPIPETLSDAACAVLNEASPDRKVIKTRAYVAAWKSGVITEVGQCPPPLHPARPAKPELKAPTEMPRRRAKGRAGQIAFVHAIAHIELNAIDLAWDMIARFTSEGMPSTFYHDWAQVALDEAEHFSLLDRRLLDLGSAYGELPAHHGLWEAALATADDLLARLAIVPMTLEARGLDTTPGAIAKLTQAGDEQTATVLDRIATEEIPHVRAGVVWFEYLCTQRNIDSISAYHQFIKTRFQGTLKPPFNEMARAQSGMSGEYYHPYQSIIT